MTIVRKWGPFYSQFTRDCIDFLFSKKTKLTFCHRTKFKPTMTQYTLAVKMCYGRSDHKCTVLNSMNVFKTPLNASTQTTCEWALGRLQPHTLFAV